MSFYEEQENIPAPRDMAKKSRQVGRRHRKGDALLRKKLADHVVVSKTLYDPADTLSNRAKKRLLREECWNDFQPDVQYSLNKHQRWRTISVPTLLESNRRSDLEVLVVNRVITPRSLNDIQNLDVSDVHVKENGTISTISARGKGQKLSHFQATLKERRQADKDEVEPARILFNVIEPHPVLSLLAGKTQRKNKKGSWATKSRHMGHDMLRERCSDDEDGDRPEPTEVARAPRSSLTLGDFLVSSSPPKDVEAGNVEQESDSWVFVDVEPECSEESTQPRPADLIDISAATNANSLFEVVDIQTKYLQEFDFPKSISLLEEERVVVRWIGQNRVMVDATYQARLRGDEPVRKPLLILFFELREGGRILRVRVNANAQYRNDLDREAFLYRAKRQCSFMSLFHHIVGSVKSLRESDVHKEKSRCSEHMEFFAAEVNSEDLAVKASRCNEYDMLEFLKNVMNDTDGNRNSVPEYIPSVRCQCPSWKRPELFETRDGMSCRDCITSYIVHQLRLNRVPVDIPLTSTENLSNIDLLYTVVPAPLISMLLKEKLYSPHHYVLSGRHNHVALRRDSGRGSVTVNELIVEFGSNSPSIQLFKLLKWKMSYSHYCRLRDPNVVFTECPRCAVEVTIPSSNVSSVMKYMTPDDLTACICPECESHWCWLCKSEPHWPMACKEFKQWTSKWDQQYFVDKYGLQPDEDLLRITCLCNAVLLVPSESAHNTKCRCGHRYDKTGLMSLDHKNFPYYARRRKYHDLAGKPKQGDRVTVERIAPVQLIGKEFADICTEARNLRFDTKKMLEFEKSASASHLEDFDLANQRRTGLVLVENCTAWLYLHRREGVYGTCKSAVSRLLQKLRFIENDIGEASPSSIFLRNAESLRKDIRNVQNLFKGSILKVEE